MAQVVPTEVLERIAQSLSGSTEALSKQLNVRDRGQAMMMARAINRKLHHSPIDVKA